MPTKLATPRPIYQDHFRTRSFLKLQQVSRDWTKLPEMDGYEATRQIRRFNKDVIIIAQTAYVLSGDRKKAIDAGCNEYLSKPIDKDELLRLMQKHFKR